MNTNYHQKEAKLMVQKLFEYLEHINSIKEVSRMGEPIHKEPVGGCKCVFCADARRYQEHISSLALFVVNGATEEWKAQVRGRKDLRGEEDFYVKFHVAKDCVEAIPLFRAVIISAPTNDLQKEVQNLAKIIKVVRADRDKWIGMWKNACERIKELTPNAAKQKTADIQISAQRIRIEELEASLRNMQQQIDHLLTASLHNGAGKITT